MKYAFCTTLVLQLALQGCFSSYTTLLEEPITKKPLKSGYESFFDLWPEGEHTASIGEELFRIRRHKFGAVEYLGCNAPTGTDFPDGAIWEGTHLFNDGKSGDLTVYTTPDYYHGNIGVILDSDEKLATAAPLVEVGGLKEGRRWKLKCKGEFFTVPFQVEQWGIRYGGLNGSDYVFETFSKIDASTSEIIQSIRITESGFLDGFVVRRVLIVGTESDHKGVIKYRVYDTVNSEDDDASEVIPESEVASDPKVEST